jgi:hypothetical protein
LRLLLRYQTEIGSDSVQLFAQLAEGWVPGTPSALPECRAVRVAMDELLGNGSYIEAFETLRAECLHLGTDASARIALNLSMDKFWEEIRVEVDQLLRSEAIARANGRSGAQGDAVA